MVAPQFSIREADEDIDIDEEYAGNPNLFSLKLHHGGQFTKFPGRRYVNGKVNFIDILDIDMFSVHELHSVMEELGYDDGGIMYYHFLVPESNLDFGLQALGNDSDVINLINHVNVYKLISVYTEHGTTKLNTYFKSPSKVVIKEIVDDANAHVGKERLDKQLLLEWHGEDIVIDETENVEVNVTQASGIKQTEDVEVNVTQASGITIDYHDFFYFNPFFDQAMWKTLVDEENEEEQSEDSDSEYLVDEENHVEEVEVDMSAFNLHIDKDVEEDESDLEGDVEDDMDVVNNDELESGSEGETKIQKKRKKYLHELNKKNKKQLQNNAYKHSFYVDRSFGTAAEVKEEIRLHSIETRRSLKMVKNDKQRIRVVCEGKLPTFNKNQESGSSGIKKSLGNEKGIAGDNDTSGQDSSSKGPSVKNKGGRGKRENPNKFLCPFVLLVSKNKDNESWVVKTLTDEHKCLQSRDIKACTSNYLSKELVDQIEGNPEIPVRALQEQLQKKLELGISWMKIFRAKRKAKGQLKEDYTEQYAKLRDYMQELMSTNPDTTVRLEVEQENNITVQTRVFKRIYVCLGALKRGFKATGRELLGLDGAFMKGPFPGQVLTAVGVDPNNGIYPLAYAIVEAENKDSWTWFLKCVGEDLDLAVNSNFTFISDRQKGIIQGLESVFPSAEHRFCLRHIHENMKSRWKGQAYKNMLWKCSCATTLQKFEKAMEELKKFNQEAYLWLAKIPPKHWSRSHFSGRAQSDVLLNNLCEVLNRQLVDGRDKPIITALEYFREYMMKRIVNVLQLIDKCDGPLTPTATKLLENVKKEAAQYTVTWNGGAKFQVSGPWGDQCVVDMKFKNCTCRKWELTGIPCKHAVASIWNMILNGQEVGLPENWVSPIYRIETWKNVYSFKVNPVNGMSMWKKTDIPTTLLPPRYHAPLGRPRKKRRRAADEEINSQGRLSKRSSTIKCAKCGNDGHNQRTCKGQGNSNNSQQLGSGSSQVGSGSAQVRSGSAQVRSGSGQVGSEFAQVGSEFGHY